MAKTKLLAMLVGSTFLTPFFDAGSKLKVVVEDIDTIPDEQKDLYVQSTDADGKKWWVLNLDDSVRSHPQVAALHRAHERQKTSNTEVKNELTALKKRFEGLPDEATAEEWERLKNLETEFAKLKEKDPEGAKAHEAEMQSLRNTYEQRITNGAKAHATELEKRDEENKKLRDRIEKMVVRDGLKALLAENGIRKDMLEFVQAKLERSAKVVEDEDTGDFVAQMATDLGDVPMSQYIENWVQTDEAKPFIDAMKGGDAKGGGQHKGSSSKNPWSAAYWSMAEQAKIVKADPAKADRLAKDAGHKQAKGALRVDAK